MRIATIFLAILCAMWLSSGCEGERAVAPTYYILVEGTWDGTLAGDTGMMATFIEGRFENSPTVTGSVQLKMDNETVTYLVMNGTHNQVDSVWFSLYRIPLAGKEEYHISGAVKGKTLEGVYHQLDPRGQTVSTGTFAVQRIP